MQIVEIGGLVVGHISLYDNNAIQAAVIKLVITVVEFKKLGLSTKLHARYEAKRKRQA